MARVLSLSFLLCLISGPAFADSLDDLAQSDNQSDSTERRKVSDHAVIDPFEASLDSSPDQIRTVQIPHPERASEERARPMQASTGLSEFMMRYASLLLYVVIVGTLLLIAHSVHSRS